MRVIAFVDYDNVRAIRDQTALDAMLNLQELFERLSATVRGSLTDPEEIDVRLYGGWVAEDGRFSQDAEWVLAGLSILRGRWNGIRVKPALITSAACQPYDVLIGTVRLRARRKRQKMVDGLITIDAMHLASEPDSVFMVISDDDDFVPCALAVRRTLSVPCFLVRLRAPGNGLNDATLEKNGVRLGVLRP